MRYRARLEPGERVITCNRAHPVKLLPPLLLLLGAVFAASFLQVLGSAGSGAWNAAALILMLAALLHVGLRGWRWAVGGFALTTRRVVIFRSWRGRRGAARPLALPLELLGEVGTSARRRAPWGSVRVQCAGRRHLLTCQREPGRFVELVHQYRPVRYYR